jgi:hypothetical protein
MAVGVRRAFGLETQLSKEVYAWLLGWFLLDLTKTCEERVLRWSAYVQVAEQVEG